jgi:hypothetical protein
MDVSLDLCTQRDAAILKLVNAAARQLKIVVFSDDRSPTRCWRGMLAAVYRLEKTDGVAQGISKQQGTGPFAVVGVPFDRMLLGDR